jgi:hypothetical protein
MPAIQDTVATGTITHRTTAHPTPCTGRFTARPRIIRETQAIVRRPTVNLDIARRPTVNLDIVHQLVSPDIVRQPLNRSGRANPDIVHPRTELVLRQANQALNQSGPDNQPRDRPRHRMVRVQRSRGQIPINRPQDRKPGLHHRPSPHPKLVQRHSPNLKTVQLHRPDQCHKAVRLHKPNRSNNLGHRTPVAAVHKGSRHKGSHAAEAANRTRASGTLLSMRACNLL